MSTKNCNRCKNPLLRDGTSQTQRFFEELDPSYVSVDERTTIDLIEFTLKYAQKIRFWETDNTTTGDWIGFIENDIATLITMIAKKNLETIRGEFQDALEAYQLAKTSDNFEVLISKSLDVALEIDSWYNQSINGLSLNQDLLKIIQTQAAPNLRILAGFDRGAQMELAVPAATEAFPPTFDELSSVWGNFGTIQGDISIFDVPGTDDVKMDNALPFVSAIFEAMLNAEEKLSKNAPAHFDQILTGYSGHEAHFTLLLAFYQLFELAQEHGNQITKRHLDFYYKEVLRMTEKDAVPDKAHLVFEPAKNSDSHLLTQGTLFKAGKDSTGKEIFFSLDKNVVINRATVGEVRNVFIHQNPEEKVNYIFSASVANSADGAGAPLESEETGWKMFGQHQKDDSDTNYIDPRTMADAEVGFAIASPELLLGEGERTVSIILEATPDSLSDFILAYPGLHAEAETSLTNGIAIQFSGAENWIQPLGETKAVINGTLNTITITTNLLVGQPPVVPYNAEMLKNPFQTTWPMAKITLPQTGGSLLYQNIRLLELRSYTIDVDVKEVTGLVVANDSGTLDASKPFQPFGAVPEVGANFYIGSTEVFSRKLKELTLTLDWQGVPSDDLAAYYKEYRRTNNSYYIGYINSSGLTQNNGNHIFNAKLKILDDYRWLDLVGVTNNPYVAEANVNNNHSSYMVDVSDTDPTASTNESVPLLFLFFALLFNYGASTTNRISLFNHDSGPDGPDPRLPRKMKINNDNVIPINSPGTVVNNTFKLLAPYGYKRDITLQKQTLAEYVNSTKRGFIKLELNSPGFLHDVYPKIQTKQAIALGKHNLLGLGTSVPEPQLPNEPYTPGIKLLALDYKSEFKVDYQSAEFQDYDNRVEQLFHIGPFGVAEIFPVDAELTKAEKPEQVFNTTFLFPRFVTDPENDTNGTPTEGEFFIGIHDLKPPQGLTLFFQFDEGTEDPELEVPVVRWSYLVNNQWIDFESSQIASDTTNGLVNSGIIEFSIPRKCTDQNTILPAGKHWLRAQVNENTRAFSNVLSLRAQAASATYVDTDNSPDRLRKMIDPGTISKFVKKDFSIKTVDQPYISFGGRIKEQSNEFFTRAAERLRHKNRAITIRDYEHLVLEAYPEIYKVKCINHTSKVSENSPGSVSVVTILDPARRNTEKPFELKVSKSKLQQIKTFLQQINSTQVDLNVRNPRFEKIKVEFGVKFKKEYSDTSFYLNQLSEDIKRFLSPWAYGDTEKIVFGGRIDKSVILNFVEERPYVDFVDDFVMHLYYENTQIGTDIQEAVAQTAASVLITNETHCINEIEC